jgi:hypothetical protein
VIETLPGQFIAQQDVRLAAAQDQLRQATRSLESSQKAIQLAQARAGEAGRTFTRHMTGMAHRSGGASRTLVLPKDATDAKALADMEEDLNVMAHILDKAADSGSDKPGRAMGIPVFVRFGGDSPQNIQIEGYGALFLLNVNFPLLPATEKEGEVNAKEKNNSEWEQARREMSQPSSGMAEAFVAMGESFDRGDFLWGGGAPAPYAADKVEELKNNLIAALKNAANIRKLKPDESVTVVVTGTAPGSGRTSKTSGQGSGKAGRSYVDPTTGLPVTEEEEVVAAGPSGERSVPAKLVVRVRKSDADAFQNGKLSLDEFKKKVTVMIY